MSLDIRLTVILEGEDPYQVDITAGTIIAAERFFKKPAPELFGNISIEAMAWLAWEQTRKSGTTVAPFDRWIENLVDIETDDAGPLAATGQR